MGFSRLLEVAFCVFRDRVFLAPRPLDYYRSALQTAGFEIDDVAARTIVADVREWLEFLGAYHDAVVGWVGGTTKVDGIEPSQEAVVDRLRLMEEALQLIFGDRDTFFACWTYVRAHATEPMHASSPRLLAQSTAGRQAA